MPRPGEEPVRLRGNTWRVLLAAIVPLALLAGLFATLWLRAPEEPRTVPRPAAPAGAPQHGWQSLSEAVARIDQRRQAEEQQASKGQVETVAVSSDPQGASVSYRGRWIGKTPFSWSEAPAGQEVELVYSLEGYRIDSLKVTVGPGARAHLKLEPAPPR